MVPSVLTLHVSTSFLTILLIFFYNFPKCTVTSSWTLFLPLSHNPFISILKNLLKTDLHKENIVMTLTYKKKNLKSGSQPQPSYLGTLLLATLIPCQSPPLHRSPVCCALTALWDLMHTYRFVPTPPSPFIAVYTHIFLFLIQDTANATSYLCMILGLLEVSRACFVSETQNCALFPLDS